MVRGTGRTWLSQQPHGVMLRDLEEFIYQVLLQLHPSHSIHETFTFGDILALCYPPMSPGQVHHFDLLAGYISSSCTVDSFCCSFCSPPWL